MMSVVVTGPRGLLGSTLLRVLADDGMSVHPFDGDIMDKAALDAFFSSLKKVDAVVHAAAATDVNRCEKEPEWCRGVNVDGTRYIRDAAASRGARFVFLSAMSVFSGVEGDYRESDPIEPKNAYNLSKADGEKIALEYEKALVLRFNLIGIHPDGSRGKNFMEWLVDTVRTNKDMKLFTDIRINPLSNWTLAEKIRDVLRRWPEGAGILHFGSSTVLSKAEIGRMVLAKFPKYAGQADYVTSDALSAVAFRPKEAWLNVDRARNEFGFSMPTLEEEVTRILDTI